MSLLAVAGSGLRGSQEPRYFHAPDFVSSAGDEVVDLCALAGLELDPWQRLVVVHALGERGDGTWAAREVGVCVPRQNGKGAIIEALELAGLFLLNERLVIHSAHLFDTSKEAMRRLLELIEGTPDFSRRVKRVVRSHGEEGVELVTGQRVRFRTRTKGGGRGLSGDRVILDEAMFLPESTMGALMPVVSARPNPQICYFGSAVDQLVHDDGVAFARVRERGFAKAERLAYFEWSVDAGKPDEVARGVWEDREQWALANPALGIRITDEAVDSEQQALPRRTFAVERLGVGDWPATDGSQATLVSPDEWAALTDERSKILGSPWFAVDVSPDRSRCSVSACGKRSDGAFHVEVVESQPGTGWVADRCRELLDRHRPGGFALDAAGPAGSLVEALEAAGVKPVCVSAQDHGRACGMFLDAVRQKRLRHLGTPELEQAVKGAATRPLGESWAWSRRSSAVDITPLVSATLALWGVSQHKPTYRMQGFS